MIIYTLYCIKFIIINYIVYVMLCYILVSIIAKSCLPTIFFFML